MKKMPTKKLSITAMLFAVGLVLPFLTGQIPQIGSMLLPLHIPVFLCGLICGWRYGLFLGFALPLVRSLLFTMPPMYPTALAMAFELASYGLICGLVYNKEGYYCIRSLYRSLLLAMAGGRVVWGFAMIALLGIKGNVFTWQAFLAGSLLNAVPGIVLQLVLIPALMLALNKTGLLPSAKSCRGN